MQSNSPMILTASKVLNTGKKNLIQMNEGGPTWFHLYFYMGMCVHMCTCVCVRVCPCTCRGQRSTLGVYYSSLYFSETGSLLFSVALTGEGHYSHPDPLVTVFRALP